MLFTLIANLLRVALAPIVWLQRVLARRGRRWVFLRLDSPIVSLRPQQPRLRRWLHWGRADTTTVSEIDALCRAIATDRSVVGLLLEVPHHLRASWTVLTELHHTIATLRAAGKSVVAYLPDGGTTRELFAALGADLVWIGPEATVGFLGVSSTSMYLRPLLDRLGVVVEVHAAGEFKTAAEPLVASEMSGPQRTQRQALLDALHKPLVDVLRERRAMDDTAIARVFADAMWRGQEAVVAGLVDGVCHADELVDRLAATRQAAAA